MVNFMSGNASTVNTFDATLQFLRANNTNIYFLFYLQLVNYSTLQIDKMHESLLYKNPVDPANWVGLKKSDDLLGYLRVRSGNTVHTGHCHSWGTSVQIVDLEKCAFCSRESALILILIIKILIS